MSCPAATNASVASDTLLTRQAAPEEFTVAAGIAIDNNNTSASMVAKRMDVRFIYYGSFLGMNPKKLYKSALKTDE